MVYLGLSRRYSNMEMLVYTRVPRGQESEALARLPDLSLKSTEQQRMVATGAEGKTDLAENLAFSGRTLSTPLDNNGQSTHTDGGKTADSKANGRIRTDNPWLQNRCTEDTTPENTNTSETSNPPLTPQWTPESPKQGEIDTSRLPTDLAEIVAVWPDLPEHIRAAIKALVQTHIREGK